MLTLTPHEFVDKWKQVTARERQIYQEHFLDLCYLLGHPTPNSFDPTGKRFGFEMGAAKTSGGQGWADVAKLEYFGWEYKARPEDLPKAYAQLLLYRDALQNPPILVVSDIRTIIIRTNFTNLPTQTYKLTLEDLFNPGKLRILKAVFFDPDSLKPQITIEGVTREAARHFSRLAGPGPQAARRSGLRRLRLAVRSERRGDLGKAAGAEFGEGEVKEEGCPLWVG